MLWRKSSCLIISHKARSIHSRSGHREELFYQLALRQFGAMPRLKLEPPAPLRPLISAAVEAEESTEGTRLTRSEIADVCFTNWYIYWPRLTTRQVIEETLMQRREMLLEYFSMTISEDGMVETIPLLLRNYSPNLDKLPLFLMRLGPQVLPLMHSAIATHKIIERVFI